MKSIKIYALALGLLAVFAGCQNDVVKPLENDKEAPAPVRDVTYTKMSGSVLLTYTLPSDPDLLYVAASYTNKAGKKYEFKASQRRSDNRQRPPTALKRVHIFLLISYFFLFLILKPFIAIPDSAPDWD